MGLLWCSHFTALPRPSSPIPGGLFLQFVKSQSLCGMVQSQERDGVGDEGKQLAFTNAVGAVKYGNHISTCARLHTQRHTHTHTHTHTQASPPPASHIDRAHNSEGTHCQHAAGEICVSVCVWGGGACMGGFVGTFDTSLTGS